MLTTILLCAALVALDQLFKYLAVTHLQPLGTAPLLPGILNLKYIENNGAAFSILAGEQHFLIAATGIALLAVAAYLLLRRPKDKLEYAAILLILSGGLGNLIDRVANGYVVDYINLLFMRFAVFNFADILVCVGFVLLVFAVFRAEYREKRRRKQKPAEGEELPAAKSGALTAKETTPPITAATAEKRDAES